MEHKVVNYPFKYIPLLIKKTNNNNSSVVNKESD